MKKVRMGLVGLNFGRHIVRDLVEGDGSNYIDLVAVCDNDATRLAAANVDGRAKHYNSIRPLLADDGIEAIGLFTGPAGRAEMIRSCLAAHKHVMTTKPFETDADAALAVLTEARSLGMVVHLNSPSPIVPPGIAQILRWRDEFDLGQPIGARVATWANYRETADGGWYDDPEFCPVAPIFRLGIYAINDLLRLFGPVAKVTVLQSRIFTGRPTADNAQLGIEFESGAIANVFASFCIDDGNPYSDGMTINFANGTVSANAGLVPSGVKSTRLTLTKRGPSGRAEVVAEATIGKPSGSYDWELFQRAVRGEEIRGEIEPLQVVESLRIIAAMKQSAATGCVVKM